MKKISVVTRTPASFETLSVFFKVLADKTRLEILFSLFGGPKCVMHICERVGMSQSAVSHQLAVLRSADLVRVVRDGKKQVYSLADEHVRIIIDMAERHLDEDCGEGK